MPLRLDQGRPDFEERFAELLARKREAQEDVREAVAPILADVRRRGDAAVIEHTRRFDRVELTPATLRVLPAEIDEAAAAVAPDVRDALAFAAARIEAFHRRQAPEVLTYRDEAGVLLGARWTPIASVGIYVPGGLAAYPSSVLMNAIPARVAGVGRIAMVVPAPEGRLNPVVLAAARAAGVDEVYRIGGAQAVAALAYGTASVRPVDKIVGPGNAYVAEAKRQVFGVVGIDMIAGPTDILVVADGANDPDWIAADLLSQAEHGADSQAVLITDDAEFADRVAQAVEAELARMPRGEIAAASWRDFGAVVVVRSLREAPALVDRLAPEHLELAVERPDELAAQVRNAGAVFLGRHTPEAVGDYVAGPNHVLPTSGCARFASGLNVLDFMKRTTLVACDAASLRAIGPAAVTLARAEGLDGHARSIAIRLGAGEGE